MVVNAEPEFMEICALDRMYASLQNSYTDATISNVMVFGDGVLGK